MPEEDWTTFYNTTKRAQIKLGMAGAADKFRDFDEKGKDFVEKMRHF